MLILLCASAAPVLMAYSSASALESAIVACVLLPSLIVVPCNVIRSPVVDLWKRLLVVLCSFLSVLENVLVHVIR